MIQKQPSLAEIIEQQARKDKERRNEIVRAILVNFEEIPAKTDWETSLKERTQIIGNLDDGENSAIITVWRAFRFNVGNALKDEFLAIRISLSIHQMLFEQEQERESVRGLIEGLLSLKE